MQVNLPPSAAKIDTHPANKPAPALAGKAPAANFNDLLKNAQAASGSAKPGSQDLTPGTPASAA